MTDYALDFEDIGVPAADGESWGELAARRRREKRPSFDCAICGLEHGDRGDALACCASTFEN